MRLDEKTEQLVDEYVEETTEARREENLVFYEGCTVVTAPTGAPPEYITVRVDGVNDPNVAWRGVPPTLNVGDEVTVWENPLSHRREIASGSGATGASVPLGVAHEIFKMNAAGTGAGFEPAVWTELVTPAGSNMVHDHRNAGTGGQNLREIQELEFDDPTTLTIAAGAITRTQVYHLVDTEGGAANDDLDTINGGVTGDVICLQILTAARTVTVRHSWDNVWLCGQRNITLDDVDDALWLFRGINGMWTDGDMSLPAHPLAADRLLQTTAADIAWATTTDGQAANTVVRTDANAGVRPVRLGVNVAVPGVDGEAAVGGHVWQILQKDMFPDGETNSAAGIWARVINRRGIANYTSHAREGAGIPVGMTGWITTPANIYAAQDAALTGYVRGTYYRMYSSDAALRCWLTTGTGAAPLGNDLYFYGRLSATTLSEVGLRVDNFDPGRAYAIGERLYYYEIYAYGNVVQTQVGYRRGYFTWDGAAWGPIPAEWTGAPLTIGAAGDYWTYYLYINYGASNNEVAGYILGESGSASNYGSEAFTIDGAVAFKARRVGIFERLRGYAGSGWDWYYKSW